MWSRQFRRVAPERGICLRRHLHESGPPHSGARMSRERTRGGLREMACSPLDAAMGGGREPASLLEIGVRHVMRQTRFRTQGRHRGMDGGEPVIGVRVLFHHMPGLGRRSETCRPEHPGSPTGRGHRQVEHAFRVPSGEMFLGDDGDEDASRRHGILVSFVIGRHGSPPCGGWAWRPVQQRTRYASSHWHNGHSETVPEETPLWHQLNHAIVNNRFFTTYTRPGHKFSGHEGHKT